MEKNLGRRAFLRMAGGLAAGALAAACQPKTVIVEKEVEKVVTQVVKETVKETVVVEGTPQVIEKEVTRVVEKEVTVAPRPREPETISFWHTNTGIETQAIIAEFNEQHPDITVEISELGGAVFGDEKYLTAIAAGKGPDVATQNRHTFWQFAAKGLYQDLTPRFEADGLKRDDYFSIMLDESSWEGKIYGLPQSTGIRVLFWNLDQFEEVGLDPGTPPTDWTELETYAEKLNQRDAQGNFQRMGFVPYLVGNTWMWLYGFLNNAPAISEDKRTILCDDPRWAEALQWMVDFYDRYLGSFEIASAFNEQIADLGDPFVSEFVSMVGHTSNGLPTQLVRKPSLRWDFAPMPIPEGGVKSTWACGWSAVLPPSAKYPDAAWEFAKWWTGVEGWRVTAQVGKAETAQIWSREQIEGKPIYMPQPPCYVPAMDMLIEEYVSELPEVYGRLWDTMKDSLANWAHGCGAEMGLAALTYWIEMDNAVRSALAHKMSPAEALSNAKAIVQEATDEAWSGIE